MIKNIIAASVSKQLAGAGDADIEFDQPLGSGVICYDHISVSTSDADHTQLLVGFKSGASILWLQSFVSTVTNWVHTTEGRIFLPAAFRPFVRIISGDAGETVTINVFGYDSDKNG